MPAVPDCEDVNDIRYLIERICLSCPGRFTTHANDIGVVGFLFPHVHVRGYCSF